MWDKHRFPKKRYTYVINTPLRLSTFPADILETILFIKTYIANGASLMFFVYFICNIYYISLSIIEIKQGELIYTGYFRGILWGLILGHK